jgi:hypothetical protein
MRRAHEFTRRERHERPKPLTGRQNRLFDGAGKIGRNLDRRRQEIPQRPLERGSRLRRKPVESVDFRPQAFAMRTAAESVQDEGRPERRSGWSSTDKPPYAAKLATASCSDSYTSNTVMSCVTVRTSLILGGRCRSFSFPPLFVTDV